ncbi:MAG TPA: LysE/ArgO family amino acid transporter [Steroidobacteraceae bacterium]|jgi:L-lysine exporter family protein LysE/ArgO
MSTPAFSTGFVLCATLIVAIGAQNAFVLRQGLRREHILAIVIFCATADLVLIAAGVAGLAALLGQAPVLTFLLTAAGVFFLSWYGLGALRRAFKPQSFSAPGSPSTAAPNATPSLRSTMTRVAGFTFLNPHVYLDTVLLMGSIGARQTPDARVWFIGGAACASCVWFTALGFGARLLAPLFARPRAWQVLDTLIGATMWVLAASLATRL